VPVTRTDGSRRRHGARRAELQRLFAAHQGDGLAVADLAALVGLHPNTVRAHLEVLVNAGAASRHPDRRRTPGRPRELYRATAAAPDDRNYLLLARVCASRPSPRPLDERRSAAHLAERDVRVRETRGVHHRARAHQPLDGPADVPDIDVHPGHHA